MKRGATRARMERLLLRAAREAARECGGAEFEREPGRVYARGDVECLKRVLCRVFGVTSVSPARELTFQRLEEVVDAAVRHWSGLVAGRKFAVRVRRVGRHDFTSLDAARAVGSALVSAGGKVDLESPDVELFIEIRNNRAFLYTEVIEGPGGLPLGSEGRVLALVSGGIDSPVAAWLIMRRGAYADVFYCNLGGTLALKRALEAIRALLSWSYGYDARVAISDCAPVARAVMRGVHERLWSIAFKRALYLAARELARSLGALAIVTGESLGQVSSQTLGALAALERGLDMPLLRPLIGMDKEEIVRLARRIGTYELSKDMPEYCAMFSRRPRKWASREEVERIDMAVHDAVREVVASARLLRKSELDSYIGSLAPQELEIDEIPPGAVVVDLRDGESYRRWHVPGALRAEPSDVPALVDKLGRDKTYVLYCYGGGLSLDVAESLRKLGVRAFSLRLSSALRAGRQGQPAT